MIAKKFFTILPLLFTLFNAKAAPIVVVGKPIEKIEIKGVTNFKMTDIENLYEFTIGEQYESTKVIRTAKNIELSISW